MSSSKIVIKNSMIGMIAQICSMIIGFVSQRYFLRYLGLEIQGINSVITETLGFLAFAELGVGTAISFRLYKPLANNDIKELSILMQLYSKLYRIIGVIVFFVGTAVMFFLPIFINDATQSMSFIYQAYMIQLAATSSSYFFAYKRSLIFVDQKQFICKIVDISCNIICSILRIIVLVIFHNFHLYLLLQLIQSVVGNVILAWYCDKHYSFVKIKAKEKFSDMKGMFKDTKNLLIGKVAGYVYSSTDNLVISTFAGVSIAGGFSTYRYVTNAVKNLTYSMTDSITATLGNSVQVRDVEGNYEVFCKYTFVRYVVANIMTTGLCICADAFVGFAFGKEYIINFWILYLICADIFIGIVYGPINEYISVLGYFDVEKYINMGGAAINLVLSIVLVQKMGVIGVLIGTVISQMFFWITKSILLFKKYFKSKEKLKKVWKLYISYIVVLLFQIVVLHEIKNAIIPNIYNFTAFLIEGCVSVLIAGICVSICYRKSEQFGFLVTIVKRVLNKFNRKEEKS